MLLRISITVLLILGAYFWYANRPITHPPGVLAPEEPLQTMLENPEPIQHRGYFLTAVARFETEARVLGKLQYKHDAPARLAPYDLAIGWGPMSDSSILDQINVIQRNRYYTWECDPYPIPPREIIRHSTNIHMVPSNASVEGMLLRIKPGHLVRLKGRLVNVVAQDGSRWNTSLSRTDAGMGACEILWVESIEIIKT